jgi:hypothetical protein
MNFVEMNFVKQAVAARLVSIQRPGGAAPAARSGFFFFRIVRRPVEQAKQSTATSKRRKVEESRAYMAALRAQLGL